MSANRGHLFKALHETLKGVDDRELEDIVDYIEKIYGADTEDDDRPEPGDLVAEEAALDTTGIPEGATLGEIAAEIVRQQELPNVRVYTAGPHGHRFALPRVTTPPAASTWEVKKDDLPPKVKACGRCEPNDETVWISSTVFARIEGMMAAYPTDEWLAYLVADDEGVFVDMFTPEQKASGSRVEVTAPPDPSVRIDGVIHSHHRMGVFHSTTDDEHLITNHPVSIVAGKKAGEPITFEAMRTVTVPCGARYTQKVPVRVAFPDASAWVTDAKTRVKVTGYTYTAPTYMTPSQIAASQHWRAYDGIE